MAQGMKDRLPPVEEVLDREAEDRFWREAAEEMRAYYEADPDAEAWDAVDDYIEGTGGPAEFLEE